MRPAARTTLDGTMSARNEIVARVWGWSRMRPQTANRLSPTSTSRISAMRSQPTLGTLGLPPAVAPRLALVGSWHVGHGPDLDLGRALAVDAGGSERDEHRAIADGRGRAGPATCAGPWPAPRRGSRCARRGRRCRRTARWSTARRAPSRPPSSRPPRRCRCRRRACRPCGSGAG